MEWREELDRSIRERNQLRERIAKAETTIVDLRSEIHVKNLAIAEMDRRAAESRDRLLILESELRDIRSSSCWYIREFIRRLYHRVRTGGKQT